ncbi:PP2C family protein-serine/threonine phosphatase [Glycomyces sp. NRRL B-16210]|uniref:PP2C family protein-serine/threonine phosphatase n=1 Tax=Glycomyces sp. NRRL B-16210 TaxID=1463821 RepID=UPI0004C0A6E3|nr:PP2C family protein-serine/threonine phosphatase [Glycomyces sp. NRRL B-16210]
MAEQVLRKGELRPGTVIPPWVRLLPFAGLILAVVVRVFEKDPTRGGMVMAVIPLLAAFVLGPLWTGVVSVAAIVLLITPLPFTGRPFNSDLLVMITVSVTALAIAYIRRRVEAGLVTMRNVSLAAQKAALPELPERVDGLECAGVYHSAQRGARIGGDLFDLRPSPYGTRMILGDVQGHGLDAVGTASMLLSVFHEAILDEPDLSGVAWRLERRIIGDAEQGYVPELFASVLLAEFAEDAAEVRLLSCGHPPPMLLRGGKVEEIDLKPVPVLGLRLAPQVRPGEATPVAFGAEDTLLAYSDGLVEARDEDGNYYPLARHLDGLVAPASPRRLVEFVWEDAVRFATRMDDDVSILAVTRVGGPAPPEPG